MQRLQWVQRLQTISQAGLTYSRDPFDRERFESPREVAAREVLEETGYVVRATKLLAVYDKAKHDHPKAFWYVYKLFISCELQGGAPKPSHETPELGFFGPTELPRLSLERVTEAQIRRMFALLAQPDAPTDFD